MPKPRVCHLTSVHPWTDTRIFHKECASLAAAGFETHLLAPNAPGGQHHGVHLHGLKRPVSGRLGRMTAGLWAVYRQALALGAGIYHFHDPELLPVGLLLKRRGKKVIYDVHEDVPQDILTKLWLPGPVRRPIAWGMERLERYTAGRVDLIVAATPYICQRFQRYGVDAVAVRNFPRLAELVPASGDWQTKDRVLCYLGGINEVRGLFQMVAAMADIDGQLLLAGTFTSARQRQEAEARPGWCRVRFLGHLDRDGVKDVLARSRVGLVILLPTSSFIHSLPVKMFEYMSAGLPVIASDFPLWREIIDTAECGLSVAPRDVAALVQAARSLLDNPAEAERLGKNGRQAVENIYNWEQESRLLIACYERLADR